MLSHQLSGAVGSAPCEKPVQQQCDYRPFTNFTRYCKNNRVITGYLHILQDTVQQYYRIFTILYNNRVITGYLHILQDTVQQ